MALRKKYEKAYTIRDERCLHVRTYTPGNTKVYATNTWEENKKIAELSCTTSIYVIQTAQQSTCAPIFSFSVLKCRTPTPTYVQFTPDNQNWTCSGGNCGPHESTHSYFASIIQHRPPKSNPKVELETSLLLDPQHFVRPKLIF